MTDAKMAEPLDVLARDIEEHAQRSEEHVIEAAVLVRKARRRVEAGEAGEITWYEWGRKNIKLSPSRLYELQCIAEAEDPAKELERLRQLTRERVKKHREKKAAEVRELEAERRDLIAWAKKATIEDVRRVLRLAACNDNASGSIGELPGPADEQAA
jgi:hypothetical protein